jgi:hypothetical protein
MNMAMAIRIVVLLHLRNDRGIMRGGLRRKSVKAVRLAWIDITMSRLLV